ncbi:glycosyltransferase family 2 protein [Schumannella soli]|uniref:Glycosyltransferase n=1 Tax=Schumannella soli TaxID=2590779 RepID=A0A506Y4S9_9MICO|nr:glycosyltransferase [Schumannella soli]TPW76407.1 glycosyltransferase [Schumannella soli]
MPRLTVLLPVHDGAATIGAAVRSTLRALPRDAELRVLDDASGDATARVVEGIADARLRLDRSARPLGVAAGLNRLLAASDSELVARMDADDLTLPGRFARQVRALRRHRADLLFGTVVQFSSGGRRIRPTAPTGVSAAAFPLHLLLTNPVAHPTLVARRAVLDELGGYASVPSEDYELWLRAAARGHRLVRDGAPAIAYRVHPAQVTASSGWRRASWTDPATAGAFDRLARDRLGRGARRLNLLAIDEALDDAGFATELDDFARAVTTAADRLGRVEAGRVRALLARRLDAVRALRRQERRSHEPA